MVYKELEKDLKEDPSEGVVVVYFYTPTCGRCKMQKTIFNKLQDKEFDSLFGRGSGAGIIFGASGGVCEAIVRTMYYMLTNKTPSKRLLEFTEIRGLKKAKEATVIINGIKINVLVVQSLPALSNIIDEVKEEN